MRDEPASNPIKNVFAENAGDIFIRDASSGREYSYAEFANSANRISDIFAKKGITRDDMVVLFLENSVSYLAVYLALFMRGAVAVPVDVNKGDEELREALAQVNIKAVVCKDGAEKKFSGHIGTIFSSSQISGALDGENKSETYGLDALDGLDYNKISLITFTSGSTGTPKGVKHSIKNLITTAEAFGKEFGFGKENVFYHNLPMSYMAGVLNLFILPMACGSSIVVGERFNVSSIPDFWGRPSQYGANTFWFIPAVLSMLMKLDRGRKGIEYAKIRRIIGCVGTAPLSPALKLEFEGRYGIELFESYGLSETLFVSSTRPGAAKPCVGKPLDGVKLDFAGDGEVLIEVPWMFLGYTNEDCGKYMSDGRYRSGDIGMIDSEGFLHITGRKKDLIKKGGLNLSPRKVEAEAELTGFFEECAVMGVQDRLFMEKVVCFYIPKTGMDIREVKRITNGRIEKKLGRDYIIDEFVGVREMPRNMNGKIDKAALRKLYGGMFDNKN